jgi:ascorbate-specific PTS system EIIC-type component UlaA
MNQDEKLNIYSALNLPAFVAGRHWNRELGCRSALLFAFVFCVLQIYYLQFILARVRKLENIRGKIRNM